jgi:predicted GNAT family N-acyltransferase
MNKAGEPMSPEIRDEVTAHLRRWLPPAARAAYARLIDADPAGWSRHPHFRGGLIVRCALRGNGYTERLLGVSSLDEVWPDLLRRAVDAPPR